MTKTLRIAVADDEVDIRNYFRKLLPRLGHQAVALASNGRELIEQCRTEHPDLVITDIHMPEVDGDEAARIVFQERQIPSILMSARLAAAHPRCAVASYVWGYLAKPLQQAEVGMLIERALQRSVDQNQPASTEAGAAAEPARDGNPSSAG
jgi:CheY-like chemotaxis protein